MLRDENGQNKGKTQFKTCLQLSGAIIINVFFASNLAERNLTVVQLVVPTISEPPNLAGSSNDPRATTEEGADGGEVVHYTLLEDSRSPVALAEVFQVREGEAGAAAIAGDYQRCKTFAIRSVRLQRSRYYARTILQ